MLELTPRVYKKNIKWSIKPYNKIDTVNMSPISNYSPESSQVFNTTTVTQVSVAGSTVTLPVANSLKATHWRCMRNDYYRPFENVNYAKARVECVMASGTQLIRVEQAIPGMPAVSLELQGTSNILERELLAYADLPSAEELYDANYSLANWIATNATTSSSTLSGTYDDNVVGMNPWVRRVVPAEVITSSGNVQITKPTAADIITKWNDPSLTARTYAVLQGWTEYTSFGQDASEFTMFPVNPQGSDLLELTACAIKMRNLSLKITCNLEKISDYLFRVTWEAPVRLAYIAASVTRGPLGGIYDLDNNAFLDTITSIKISLSGKPFSTDAIDLTYGLDSNSKLTTSTTNKYPLKLEKSEFLTLGTIDTHDNNIAWTESLAKKILIKYKLGKYLFQCDVLASWAIKNNVKTKTRMKIRLPTGEYIRRNGRICPFEVLCIEKIFNQNSFLYTLKLMEV